MITTRTTLFSRVYATAVWWISTTVKSKIAVSIGPTTSFGSVIRLLSTGFPILEGDRTPRRR